MRLVPGGVGDRAAGAMRSLEIQVELCRGEEIRGTLQRGVFNAAVACHVIPVQVLGKTGVF